MLVALALAGLLAPPLADLIWNGWGRVFACFAGDAYAYLTVARNLVETGLPTFDQERITNGFHPLWQLSTGLLYASTHSLGLAEPVFLVVVFLTGLLLLGLAALWIAGAFRLALGRVPAAFPVLPVGLYALGMAALTPRYGSLWSFANGMESAVTLAAFGWALRCMVRCETDASMGAAMQLSVALATLLLARLDHGVFALVALTAYGLRDRAQREVRRGGLLALTLPFTLALIAYLAFNWLTASSPLPVSGALKSSFPWPQSGNYDALVRLLTEPTAVHPGVTWRLSQMLLPGLVAALALPWLASLQSRGRADILTRPLVIACVSSLALATYNFLFVGLWNQGHWYFPASVVLMTVLTLYLWEKERPATGPRTTFLVAGLSSACVLLFFIGVYHDPDANRHYAKLYEAREELALHFAGDERPRLIEYDDGIVAFTTGLATLSGLGLTVDREALPWLKRGRILWLAYERGHDHIASLNYFRSHGLTTRTPSEEIRDRLSRTFFMTPEALEPFDFRVVYVTESGSLAFIKMELKRCPAEPVFRACRTDQ